MRVSPLLYQGQLERRVVRSLIQRRKSILCNDKARQCVDNSNIGEETKEKKKRTRTHFHTNRIPNPPETLHVNTHKLTRTPSDAKEMGSSVVECILLQPIDQSILFNPQTLERGGKPHYLWKNRMSRPISHVSAISQSSIRPPWLRGCFIK